MRAKLAITLISLFGLCESTLSQTIPIEIFGGNNKTTIV